MGIRIFRGDKALQHAGVGMGQSIYQDGFSFMVDGVNQTQWARNEFEYQQRRIVDLPLYPISFREHVTVISEAFSGTEMISYNERKSTGRMGRVGRAGGGEIPQLNRGGRKRYSKVEMYAIAACWSHRDVIRAMATGQRLPGRDLPDARQANDETMNDLGWLGDDEAEFSGFLNNEDINKSKATTAIQSMTRAEARDFFCDHASDMVADTNMVEHPDRWLLTPGDYHFLIKEEQGAQDNTDGLIKELRPKLRDITRNQDFDFYPVNELVSAWKSTDNMAVLGNFDRTNVVMDNPSMFQQMAPERHGMEWRIVIYSEFGEVIVYRPRAFRFFWGV